MTKMQNLSSLVMFCDVSVSQSVFLLLGKCIKMKDSCGILRLVLMYVYRDCAMHGILFTVTCYPASPLDCVLTASPFYVCLAAYHMLERSHVTLACMMGNVRLPCNDSSTPAALL
jgi:hypothetical protein